MDDNALTELTKLLFNITEFLPQSAASFTPSIAHIFTIFQNSNQIPPQQPISSVLNALINLDSKTPEWDASAFPAEEPTKILSRITTMLASLLNKHPDSSLDTIASPIIALLLRLTSSAPEAGKSFLKETLLPSAADREEVLGRSKSLSSRLLQLSNSPSVPNLSGTISHLLFELSDSNPDTFVKNVGLGYASGFLVSQGLPLPGADGETGSTGDANINPITGQRRDREEEVDLPPMTDEEKEREAERLFVLFERLKATGVMDVRNPVEDAHRFEEVEDSD
jgi:hypothetical protein